MPECAMKRLALLPFLFCSALGLGATPQEVLAKRYKDFNTNILKSDSKAMGVWLKSYCTGDFSYTSYQKNKFNRDGYLTGILGQMARIEKVLKSTATIRSFKQTGSTIVATVASEFKGIVAMDTKKLVLTDLGVTYETWVLAGKEWKLSKIVQVNADLHMQDPGN